MINKEVNKKKYKGWVNVLKQWNSDELFMQAEIYPTKKLAIKDGWNSITDSLEIVATIKIEWEDKI